MKKVFKVIGIIILLFILALVFLPIIFKGKIKDAVLTEANNMLKAEIALDDVSVSLITDFPKLHVELEGFKVSGVDAFEGVDLAKLGNLSATIDIMNVIAGDQVNLHSITLSDAYIHVSVLEDGTANYDIMKETDTVEETPEVEVPEEESNFQISLKHYALSNVNLVYNDQEGNIFTELLNFNHSGSGDFTASTTDLETMTDWASFTVGMDGINYLNKLSGSLDMTIGMDLEAMKFEFKENVLKANDLQLNFDGWFAMREEGYEMDINAATTQTQFKSVLSLIPSAYTADFDQVETSGSFNLKAAFKGMYSEENGVMSLPAFNIALGVSDARFQYPDLPASVEDINIDFETSNPGGSEDNTIVNLKHFGLSVAENPFSARMYVSTPVSNPNVDAAIKGTINFDNLKEVMPLEGSSLTGTLKADAAFKAKMSDVEAENYENIEAKGELILLGFNYLDTTLAYPVTIETAYMSLSPQFVDVSRLQMQVGRSDFDLKGRVENLLPYYYDQGNLVGMFSLNSQLIDVNEFMEEDTSEVMEEGETSSDSTELMTVVEIPNNLDLMFNANVQKIIYDNMDMTDAQGQMLVKDSRVDLKEFSMNMLEGSLKTTGHYETTNPEVPTYSFDMLVKDWSVQKTAETFNTVEKLAPALKGASGAFSSSMVLNGTMDKHMEPIMETVYGKGKLTTHNVELSNRVLGRVDEAIKTKGKFNPLHLNDVDIVFEIIDGKLITEPFDIKADKTNMTIEGYSALDETMNYNILLDAPMDQFGASAADYIGGLKSSLESKLGVSAGNFGDQVKMKIRVHGPMENPKITPGIEGLEGDENLKDEVKEQVKEAIKEEVDKKKEELKAEAQKQADKLLKDAQEQADKIRSEGKSKANKLRREGDNAADLIVEEADKQADKLVSDAKNPIAKTAAKQAAKVARKEAEKKAQQTRDEAEKNALKIEQESEKQAQKVMDEAQTKADELLNTY